MNDRRVNIKIAAGEPVQIKGIPHTIIEVLQWTFLNIPPFSVFLAIFHVLECVFLIFRDFQFSRHIPGPSVCISHFSRFLVISSFFK